MNSSHVNETRRALLKSGIAAGAAMTVGIPITPIEAAEAQKADQGIAWQKGVCRFCGTGCGLLVGTRDGRVVATKGDPDAPVNRGLNCVKGYFNAKIMYGKDRLTQPLMRKKDGKFDKNGKFEAVSWDEAFDEMARQFKRVYKEKGPAGVSIIGSGQYTIPEAYTASKLIKAGFRSNNIDPNARLCMASAVVAFYQVFGVDEPANNYSDFEKADTILLWGNNMAEAHPVLWSRIANHKITDKKLKVINITTYRNLSSDLADETIIFKPNSDLAILNFIIREIIHRGLVNKEYVEKNCVFATGVTDIGYGLPNTDKFAYAAERDVLAKQHKVKLSQAEGTAMGPMGFKAGQEVEQKNNGGSAGKHWQISYEEFARGVEPYTLDFVAPLAKGDPDQSLESFKKQLMDLADLVCLKDNKLLSLWCMGMNQHQRGVWVNELVYSMHLLLGKHALPGCGAFSLTGQPSACGSSREVGAFCHRLPSDMLVANPKHREKAEKLWHLPAGTLNPKVGASLMEIMRGLEDGSINFVWTQVVNVLQSAPNNTHWVKAFRDPKNFVVVADAYPTYSAQAADLVLPCSMIFEKWGFYGNAERRTQGWQQAVEAPGQARTDVWMMMEFAKRFTLDEVWRAQPLKGVPNDTLPDVREAAKAMGYDLNATLFDVLFAPDKYARQAAWPDPLYKGRRNATGEALGLPYFPEKALFNEYRQFTLGGHDLADFDTYMNEKCHGLKWPVVNGKETEYRFNPDYDPYVKDGKLFYGPLMKATPTGNLSGVTDKTPKPLPGKAKIFFRPYMDPVEQPDANYDLWLCTGRILEQWHTGSMTDRVPEIHRATGPARLYMNPKDAEARGIRRGDTVIVRSRHGETKAKVETQSRNFMPRGTTWMAFFDPEVMCNAVTIDSMDPISQEPDYKKTAVKVIKA
ncbi:MAG: Periplasmic nitrate reductase [Burkholderia sp.]|jgi:nitrate reductase (cytochrome)